MFTGIFIEIQKSISKMKNQIMYYAWFLKAFLLDKEDYSKKLFEEYQNQIFSLQARDNGWDLNQKQIRATVFLYSCFTRRGLALEGHVKYSENSESMKGIHCLFETTKEQGIFHEVLEEVQHDLKKEIAYYLSPDYKV